MDIERAKELLQTLANGVDPFTGELLPEQDSCNQVEVVRALYTVLRALDVQPKKKLPENAGKPWTKEEDETLCIMFESGAKQKEICAYFKRTSGAITSRLARLGMIK